MSASPSPTLQLHRESLRQAFGAWLVGSGPRSVLDVGAGHGELLADLTARGIDARGIEPDPAAGAAARRRGVRVDEGPAWPLPDGDRSVDWVILRHVLHHLSRPAAAVREAVRVAATGVMLAEPLCWSEVPAHRGTRRLERLTRDLERRRGLLHGPDLAPAELVAMIPAGWSVEVRVHAPLTRLSRPDVDALVERSRAGQRLFTDDEDLLEELRASADSGLLAAPGTVMVRAVRP